MSLRLILFIVLLILNMIVAAVYLVINSEQNQKQTADIYIKAIVMFLCPVVGPAFFGMAYLFHWVFKSFGIDLSDVIFDKEKVERFMRPDEDVERNMVSLEEALEIKDKKNLRTLMMNVILGDYRSSLSSITSALNSEDSETAHYAASVLQDVLNEFRFKVQDKYMQSKQEGLSQVSHCIDLIEYMEPIMSQKILTDLEQASMADKMEESLEIVWNKNKNRISSNIYEKLCNTLLEVEDYEKCQKWCDRLKKQYPKNLASYTMQMKLYFSDGDRDNFFRVMNELKHSDIAIDNETLELIRTFM